MTTSRYWVFTVFGEVWAAVSEESATSLAESLISQHGAYVAPDLAALPVELLKIGKTGEVPAGTTGAAMIEWAEKNSEWLYRSLVTDVLVGNGAAEKYGEDAGVAYIYSLRPYRADSIFALNS